MLKLGSRWFERVLMPTPALQQRGLTQVGGPASQPSTGMNPAAIETTERAADAPGRCELRAAAMASRALDCARQRRGKAAACGGTVSLGRSCACPAARSM